MKNITDEIASTFLGKKVSGSATYDPTLLVKVPRFENRKQYEISNNNLPFTGWDVWHAYEFSVMTEKGLPITRVLKLKYNCNNEYLVESKSLKLYLNSFNMTRFGNNISECLEICKHKIEHDLSKTLETSVEIEFLDDTSEVIPIYQNFQNILNTIEIKDLVIDKFKEAPEVLEIKEE
ncbi:NADPH-dependent 7-cyano-7-deazaguanine reductase QueF, partial [bacterium]|nr:NADPH-dependent 7-cyano-7-deazaguanine reductase QueF [bacterium]